MPSNLLVEVNIRDLEKSGGTHTYGTSAFWLSRDVRFQGGSAPHIATSTMIIGDEGQGNVELAAGNC